eukprot:283738-Pelagomonas_calceolata.AAC.1
MSVPFVQHVAPAPAVAAAPPLFGVVFVGETDCCFALSVHLEALSLLPSNTKNVLVCSSSSSSSSFDCASGKSFPVLEPAWARVDATHWVGAISL